MDEDRNWAVPVAEAALSDWRTAMVRLIEPKTTRRIPAGRTVVFETIMVRPPEPRMRRKMLARRSVVFVILAGFALCLLAFQNFTIPSHKTVNGRTSSSLAIASPTGASTRLETIQPQIDNSPTTRLATPQAVAPNVTVPTVVFAPTPTRDPIPTGEPAPTEQPAQTVASAQTPTQLPAPSSTVATSTGQNTPTAASEPQAMLRRLLIPAIGVNAPVEVKTVDGGVMQAPDSPSVVAWYDFSAQPGTLGNAVFAGHLDYAGVGPAVFWRLDQLQPGDEIDVDDGNGTSFRYRVATIESYSATADASQIVASTGTPTITLITCNGTFDQAKGAYDQRIVITGRLIE